MKTEPEMRHLYDRQVRMAIELELQMKDDPELKVHVVMAQAICLSMAWVLGIESREMPVMLQPSYETFLRMADRLVEQWPDVIL